MIARRPKLAKCRQCKAEFMLGNPLVRFFSPLCIRKHSEVFAAKVKQEEAKLSRAEIAKQKEAAKGRGELLADAQDAFNAFIRARDANQPCICCGKPFEAQRYGGSVDAGHYLGRGAAPHLRFEENNVHAQRKNCNRPGGTTREKFRAGMIGRIGLEAVEALECDQTSRDWSHDDIRAIKATYKAKLKLLKAAK